MSAETARGDASVAAPARCAARSLPCVSPMAGRSPMRLCQPHGAAEAQCGLGGQGASLCLPFGGTQPQRRCGGRPPPLRFRGDAAQCGCGSTMWLHRPNAVAGVRARALASRSSAPCSGWSAAGERSSAPRGDAAQCGGGSPMRLRRPNAVAEAGLAPAIRTASGQSTRRPCPPRGRGPVQR